MEHETFAEKKIVQESDDKVKTTVCIGADTKALLDRMSRMTGIKKGTIIDKGIKLECDRLAKIGMG